MIDDYSHILDQVPPSGIRRFFELVIGAEDVISLGVGEPDFATPWTIREEGIYCLENGITSYTSNKGLLELRQGISSYLQHRYACSYDPSSEIIVTSGVSEGVDIALRTILNPGDEVILPEPTYVCYKPLIQLAGGVCVPMDTSKSDFIPDPADIERKITPKTKAIILCSPSNPTGMVIPKDTLIAIGKLAEKYDFWVFSDEIYSELIYDITYTSFASLKNMKKRTLLLSGFSKSFAMTGWRLGFMCGPEALISRALKIHQYSALCAPIISQYAGVEALKNATPEVEKMRASYQQRRNLFIKKMNAIGLTTLDSKGAFYCFSSVRSTPFDSETFALKLLEEERVAVVPGNVFGQGGEGYIRCCYATSLDSLKVALSRIDAFVKRHAT